MAKRVRIDPYISGARTPLDELIAKESITEDKTPSDLLLQAGTERVQVRIPDVINEEYYQENTEESVKTRNDLRQEVNKIFTEELGQITKTLGTIGNKTPENIRQAFYDIAPQFDQSYISTALAFRQADYKEVIADVESVRKSKLYEIRQLPFVEKMSVFARFNAIKKRMSDVVKWSQQHLTPDATFSITPLDVLKSYEDEFILTQLEGAKHKTQKEFPSYTEDRAKRMLYDESWTDVFSGFEGAQALKLNKLLNIPSGQQEATEQLPETLEKFITTNIQEQGIEKTLQLGTTLSEFAQHAKFSTGAHGRAAIYYAREQLKPVVTPIRYRVPEIGRYKEALSLNIRSIPYATIGKTAIEYAEELIIADKREKYLQWQEWQKTKQGINPAEAYELGLHPTNLSKQDEENIKALNISNKLRYDEKYLKKKTQVTTIQESRESLALKFSKEFFEMSLSKRKSKKLFTRSRPKPHIDYRNKSVNVIYSTRESRLLLEAAKAYNVRKVVAESTTKFIAPKLTEITKLQTKLTRELITLEENKPKDIKVRRYTSEWPKKLLEAKEEVSKVQKAEKLLSRPMFEKRPWIPDILDKVDDTAFTGIMRELQKRRPKTSEEAAKVLARLYAKPEEVKSNESKVIPADEMNAIQYYANDPQFDDLLRRVKPKLYQKVLNVRAGLPLDFKPALKTQHKDLTKHPLYYYVIDTQFDSLLKSVEPIKYNQVINLRARLKAQEAKIGITESEELIAELKQFNKNLTGIHRDIFTKNNVILYGKELWDEPRFDPNDISLHEKIAGVIDTYATVDRRIQAEQEKIERLKIERKLANIKAKTERITKPLSKSGMIARAKKRALKQTHYLMTIAPIANKFLSDNADLMRRTAQAEDYFDIAAEIDDLKQAPIYVKEKTTNRYKKYKTTVMGHAKYHDKTAQEFLGKSSLTAYDLIPFDGSVLAQYREVLKHNIHAKRVK